MTQSTPSELELARLIVTTLNLEIAAEEIDPEIPLFSGGLELDSIDLLEIALTISKNFGFKLRSDDADNERIFASLRALSAHIEQHRAR
jgi:acyl carrier protein